MATVTLTDFKCLTIGLKTGNKIKILINFRCECSGVFCYAGWPVHISGKLNGHVTTDTYVLRSWGTDGGRDGVELVFSGVMPDHAISGELTFMYSGIYLIAKEPITLLNTDDIPDPPEPLCREGAIDCQGYSLYKCENGRWVFSKANATECGWTPEPPPPPVDCTSGQTKCSGKDLMICWNGQWVLSQANATSCGGVTPPPPIPTPTGCSLDADCPSGYKCVNGKCVAITPIPGVPGWFEKYKWWVIGGSIAVIIAAIVFLGRRK